MRKSTLCCTAAHLRWLHVVAALAKGELPPLIHAKAKAAAVTCDYQAVAVAGGHVACAAFRGQAAQQARRSQGSSLAAAKEACARTFSMMATAALEKVRQWQSRTKAWVHVTHAAAG